MVHCKLQLIVSSHEDIGKGLQQERRVCLALTSKDTVEHTEEAWDKHMNFQAQVDEVEESREL